MNNHGVSISSHGVGEIYLDIGDMYCFMHNLSCFNFKKEIPFFKLILDMTSLHLRYYVQINGNCLSMSQTLLDIGKISTYLIKIFNKIKSLTEDLFCTGDIETLDYSMEVLDNL